MTTIAHAGSYASTGHTSGGQRIKTKARQYTLLTINITLNTIAPIKLLNDHDNIHWWCMASPQNRTYLRPTREAAELLGKLIRLGRRERKMTEEDLAGRAGISRRTLQKIERGNPKCEIGLVFEVANLVGVKLFGEEGGSNLSNTINRADDKLALLPKRTRKVVTIDDEF